MCTRPIYFNTKTSDLVLWTCNYKFQHGIFLVPDNDSVSWDRKRWITRSCCYHIRQTELAPTVISVVTSTTQAKCWEETSIRPLMSACTFSAINYSQSSYNSILCTRQRLQLTRTWMKEDLCSMGLLSYICLPVSEREREGEHMSTPHRQQRYCTCCTGTDGHVHTACQDGSLTFESLRLTLCTNSFNIQKFCILHTMNLRVLRGSQNKQRFFSIQQ